MSNLRQTQAASRQSSPSLLSKIGAVMRNVWALFELQSQLQLKAATSYARGPVQAAARRDRRS
ncbi:hypothetical protein [Burkholderia glumae]|uniref:Uncharacterized protein n=1 Tax=Burkholderia glumae TaxID=337 RepID=A0ABY5B643_BURGL|nr:hypothetical protein [Burkholderia glumae]AJY64521.1 hypothetical protein KS03_4610 [Burkholderia glumae LMG 2196 = ATCC 33617]MCM2485137.1 hypothetical protein [Burkholderia glumae]MCM2510830.1 hypothetical protein [Burkholderia glumae]MCM2546492.1 hypothetical protein [Burkholderia glumae]PNL06021.1 hypothetical protein CEQ24_009220 [Burkholderia glumae]